MPQPAILAVDQGSSSTRCVAYDERLSQLAVGVRRVVTDRPRPGIAEHDPDQLLAGVLGAIDDVRGQIGARHAAGVGIANQTETFVLWERDSGRAVSPVVSWQDSRAGDLCAVLRDRPGGETVSDITGLPIDPTFSALKLAWLLDRDPTLHARAEAGEVLFGDVACWLAWQLSGGAGHVCEPSNACRTLLVDLDSLMWDARMLELFGVPQALLPEIRPSDAPGLCTAAAVAGFEAPIAAMLGDQPAALYGQGCTRPRMAALTLGTGAFLWLNVGPARPQPPPGVLATAAWDSAAHGRTYALEAFGANAGNALAVLRDIGLVPGSWPSHPPDWARPHPVVVPAPSGLGTPHWHPEDRITVLGASSATSTDDLAAAALAGIAHQIADALDAIDAARSADTLRVGGGLAADEGLLQTVADLSGITLEVSGELEATARGIAALAADSAGMLDPGAGTHSVARRVAPRLGAGERERERAGWRDALEVHMRPTAGA